MAEKKVPWNDIQNGNAKEIMKHYKLSERQMEKKVREHLHGASRNEITSVYNQFYSSKDK